jgi:exodeoxyribonuclease VII small subunit
MPMPKTKNIPIETTFEKLDALASKLESDEVNLEDSLKAFEEGIKLVRTAQKKLQEAEQHVQLLIDQNGRPQAEPFIEVEPE